MWLLRRGGLAHQEEYAGRSRPPCHGGDETLPADMAPAHARVEPYGTPIAGRGMQTENGKVFLVWERAVRNLRTAHLIGLSTEEASPFV